MAVLERYQFRHDTAANWTAANPVLLSGEIGIETDGQKWKLGDGVTAWNSLAYSSGPRGKGSDIRVYTWVVSSPAVGGVPGPKLDEAHTVTRISSYVVGGTSATFNVEERPVIGTPGTDCLSADQVAVASGAEATSFADAAWAKDSWLWIDISDVVGGPDQLVISVAATVS